MSIIDCVNKDGDRCRCQDDLISEVERKIKIKCQIDCFWHYAGYTDSDRDNKIIEIYHEAKGTNPRELRLDMFWCGHNACHPDDILSIIYEASAVRLLADKHDEYLSYYEYLEAFANMKRLHFNIPKRIKRKYRRLIHNEERFKGYYWHSRKRGKL